MQLLLNLREFVLAICKIPVYRQALTLGELMIKLLYGYHLAFPDNDICFPGNIFFNCKNAIAQKGI